VIPTWAGKGAAEGKSAGEGANDQQVQEPVQMQVLL